jgi:ubiquinone/menaquinone biosynthesis C-methylase UbiE
MFAEAGADLNGVDLTDRAIKYTHDRLEIFGLKSRLEVADAENLPFPQNNFDLVYSWGVIHHSPDTQKAATEIHRVLKKGGIAKIMIYHKYSLVGFMLWIRYALLKGRFNKSLDDIYAEYLESSGTKAYSIKQAKALFSDFSEIINIKIELSSGDLLMEHSGQRHRGPLLNLAKRLYPRSLIKMLFKNYGLFMLLTLKK